MSARPARCATRRPERLSPIVNIEHRLSSGAGHALLDVPGLTFGPNLQPEEITRLTEGVIALVNGTITGQGRIDWAAAAKSLRRGDFSTAGLDLAAPFGPVSGAQRQRSTSTTCSA